MYAKPFLRLFARILYRMTVDMSYETRQGKLIKDFLKKSSEKHYSADEVYFELKSAGESIGKTTVYRQLEKLADEGSVKKFSSGINSACCYQFFGDGCCHNHYHLKCSKCGKLFHLECEFINELSEHIYKEHGFKIDDSKMIFYGLCKECR